VSSFHTWQRLISSRASVGVAEFMVPFNLWPWKYALPQNVLKCLIFIKVIFVIYEASHSWLHEFVIKVMAIKRELEMVT
jgi:hypothetical protein